MASDKDAEDCAEVDQWSDVRGPARDEIVSEFREMGDLGRFMLRLVEEADAHDTELLVDGFGTQGFDVSFGGRKARFCLDITLGSCGHEGVIGSQWSIGTLLYKQRWFREILDAMPEQDWLTVRPLTIVALAEELTDQTLDGVYLWKRYPNVNTRLMIGIIGEETRALDEHFHYEALPGRDFYFVIFRDRGMRERFLDDDPAFRATFEPILRDAIPNIYTRLEAENGNL